MNYTSSGVAQPGTSIKKFRSIIAGPIGTPGYSELLASNGGLK